MAVSRKSSSIPSSSEGRAASQSWVARRWISVRRSASRILLRATRWIHAGRVVGNAPGSPRLQGVEQRGLHHFLDEIKVSPAEESGQDGDQSPRLAAEEMLDEGSDRFWLCGGHETFAAC